MTELERPMLYPAYGPSRLWRVRAPLAVWRAGVRLLRRLWSWRPPHTLFPRRVPVRTDWSVQALHDVHAPDWLWHRERLRRETERLEQRKAQLPWGPYL